MHMRNSRRSLHSWRALLFACLLASVMTPGYAPAQAGRSIVPMLQERLGLEEKQVRGALGALLVFVREQLPKPDFNDLARVIPNADRIMQEVKRLGIVTKPLDDIGEYEAALATLGIGQPLASQFAPAVLQALGETGHTRERDILARAMY
jgi:Protein of unknown function VcgC/VcgE (DUF2780)